MKKTILWHAKEAPGIEGAVKDLDAVDVNFLMEDGWVDDPRKIQEGTKQYELVQSGDLQRIVREEENPNVVITDGSERVSELERQVASADQRLKNAVDDSQSLRMTIQSNNEKIAELEAKIAAGVSDEAVKAELDEKTARIAELTTLLEAAHETGASDMKRIQELNDQIEAGFDKTAADTIQRQATRITDLEEELSKAVELLEGANTKAAKGWLQKTAGLLGMSGGAETSEVTPDDEKDDGTATPTPTPEGENPDTTQI